MKSKYISVLFFLLCIFLQAQKSNYYYTNEKPPIKPLDSKEKQVFIELFGDKKSQNFVKEKVYAQTNHVFYRPGDILYFKAYVVNSQNNTPADWSKILYAELYDPSGNRIQQYHYQILNGSSYGDFEFPENAKGGIYKLRLYTNWMRNENHKNYFEKEITVQKTSSPRILMKLDFPKKGLSAGEEVLADFSLRNLDNLSIPFYEGNYEVFVEGKEYLSNVFTTDKDGKVQLKFKLPKNLNSTDVLLNIKLDYNAFQESISRIVPVTLNQIDIMFFPEGGNLVNGIESNLAFKAVNEFQQPVDIKAEIIDENGNKISEAESVKFGMGKFTLQPIKDKKLFLKLTSHTVSKLYELPAGKNEGVVLNIDKTGNKIILKVKSENDQKVNIEAAFRGETVDTKKNVNSNSEIYFDENIFPSGIARFTVFDISGKPLAERVVFVNKNKNVHISLKTDKTDYLPREKVVLDIQTNDVKGNPVSSNLSLSVLDDKLYSYADDRQNHLISWLQMDSELQGKIEEPSFYFKKEEPKSDIALDLVMLTNGYRYFELLPEIQEKGIFPYRKEELNSVYGKILDDKGNATEAEVFLVSGVPEVLKQTTKKGRFYFKNFSSDNSYQLVAKSKNKKQNIKIELLAFQMSSDVVSQKIKSNQSGKDFEAVVYNPVLDNLQDDNQDTKSYNQPSYQNKKRINVRYKSDTTSKTQDIEEVVTIGYGITKKALNSASVQVVTKEIIASNIANALQGKVAGIEVTPSSGIPGNAQSVIIRGISSISGSQQPLVVIDGIPVDFPNLNINSDNIESVIVLKDAAATAIYGSRGSNGVVIIKSNSPGYYKTKIDLNKNTYYAYEDIYAEDLISTSYSRVFRYPVYETPVTDYRTDFRETIYWNPIIQTDKNGKAKVEFYNSDANTVFRAIAEGISYNGLLGREEKTYSAKSTLQIDAKIPQNLTFGDEAKISVVFRNNAEERKNISFRQILPLTIKKGITDSLIVLNPKESGRIILPIKGNKISKSNLQLIAETDTEKERQILPLNIEPKGFMHYFEHVISMDSTVVFEIPDYFDESLSSRIEVFRNTASKLLNDVERLKEKPHGCFEQTSSTTYPNYFILKYLQNKGSVDDREARRAIELLKTGYERLLTFETKDQGFSLFGNSPPSITLTAYGLMEFNDLKNVLDVKPALIERTARFILSRKDGKGNFILSNNSKKEEDAVKNQYYWSQQSYILYALSESGMKDEIQKEFSHLYQINQYSDDFYILSLMANIAYQLNRSTDYDFLIKRMSEKFYKNIIVAETNFMQGRGSDIKKEALSLFALAVMKSPNADKSLLTKIINRINLSDSGNYESTQTLVLKLKALTEFYKIRPDFEKASEPQIWLNDSEIQPLSDIIKSIKKGTNRLKVKYDLVSGYPVMLSYKFNNLIPDKNPDPEIFFTTALEKSNVKIGDNVRMNIEIQNPTSVNFGMITSKIGIPAGLTMDPKNLKAMIDRKEIAYYEIFDNYLVLYWYNLPAKKNIKVNLDAKAEFAGKYTGKASHVFEYYYQQNYQWTDGITIDISE